MNTCDESATDMGSLRCTWIDTRAAPAGPARLCEGVCVPSMRRCSPFLFRAPTRARGWLGPGAHGHLEALCALVGARRCGGGYRVALPAEVRGLWEVGGQGPGMEAAEPEIVRPLAKGASELPQVGAEVALVVSAERFLSDRLPCVVGDYPVVAEGRYEVIPIWVGVSLPARHIGVTSGEFGHKSVPSASICAAPVDEGQ